ncbi:hypothetical protein P154DRAFT_326679 [Amniculicola lignicola CBS 123094]|uniref:RRM domain-containing protein n=1 Tax=Amniculicola lignicola CBS 123094 TaxID=1392246 RepID=A0A6A5W4F0_9PLEO|nr:hypothetical protein P154DRAFT_326679 [Amniculicola lignicola CBS 123094]
MPALRLNDQDMPASFEDPAAMLRELEQNKHPRIGQSSLQDFKKLHQESMTASLEDPVATLRELESSKYPNVGQSNLQGPKKPHQESTAASFEDPAVVLGELESGKHRARGQGSFDDFERLRLEMEAAFHIGGKAAEKSTLTKAMPTKGLPTKVTHSKAEALAEAPDTLVEYIAARSEQIEDEQATAWEEYAKLENGSTVIVTNIAAGADEEDVMDLFGYFSIRHMKLLSKRDPQTRTQVAHVNMNSRASAKMAVRRLEHEIRVTGGGRIFGLPINVQLMVKD